MSKDEVNTTAQSTGFEPARPSPGLPEAQISPPKRTTLRWGVNGLVLVGIVALVIGVAWYKSDRKNTQTTAGQAAAQAGELCPDPPPGAANAAQAGTPGSTSQPSAAKIPRVVDLGATQCKACKELAPILEQLKKEYAGRVTVEFIDVWKNEKAGEPYKIRVIPTQIFFDREGKEIWRHEGFLPKADFIAKFRELGVK